MRRTSSKPSTRQKTGGSRNPSVWSCWQGKDRVWYRLTCVRTSMIRGRSVMEFDGITAPEWEKVITFVYRKVSENPKCAPILEDIGHIHFQLLMTDRPELSYWEEYLGDRVISHLGILEEYTVQAATTFPVLIGTM